MFKAENLPAGCPPLDAQEQNIENVYRLVSFPPCEDDFKTHVEGNMRFPEDLYCEANALSFFTNIEKAKKMSKQFKKFKKSNVHMYCGNITSEFGRHRTKNKHLNLWVYKEINILNVFTEEGVLIENH